MYICDIVETIGCNNCPLYHITQCGERFKTKEDINEYLEDLKERTDFAIDKLKQL